jgi:hypothetical protein
MRDDFCILILSYNRPDNVKTVETLEEHGYTGDWYIVIDHEDDYEPYIDEFGEKNIVYLNKDDALPELDRMDNFDRRNCNVYARDQSFKLASELGYQYFGLFDDDYEDFRYRWNAAGEYDNTNKIWDLDRHFELMVQYLENAGLDCFAMSQSGDWLGGENATIANGSGEITARRKVMNSFICKSDNPFTFRGTLNEDVNAYVREGQLGKVFLTHGIADLSQERTQQHEGGLTEAYLDDGTYVKSFYTVLLSPSSVKIGGLGEDNKRIHHRVNWRNTVPKIVPESTKD